MMEFKPRFEIDTRTSLSGGHVGVHLTRPLLDTIEQLAEKTGLSKAEVIRQMIDFAIRHMK